MISFFIYFNFTHLKLTKNRIVSLSVILVESLHSTSNSLDRAFVIAIIDCVSFIVVCRAAADRVRRRSRTSESADVAVRADRERSWSPMFSGGASAFRSSRDAGDFYALSMSFSCDTVDGRTRTRRACRTARACLGSVVWVSSSTRRCAGSRDIPEAHLSHQMLAVAF